MVQMGFLWGGRLQQATGIDAERAACAKDDVSSHLGSVNPTALHGLHSTFCTDCSSNQD